jgi:hypothetical protein
MRPLAVERSLSRALAVVDERQAHLPARTRAAIAMFVDHVFDSSVAGSAVVARSACPRHGFPGRGASVNGSGYLLFGHGAADTDEHRPPEDNDFRFQVQNEC